MRVVLDTNVLVSGLLSESGPPGLILDMAEGGRLSVLYDDRVMAEYRDVLGRPHFPFRAEAVAAILALFVEKGERVEPVPLAVELPDPDDLPFLEVAVAGRADALVTGNGRHFPPARCAVPVLSPAAFLAVLMS